MSTSLQLAVEKAIAELAKRNVFKKGNAEFEVRRLFQVQSWQPHTEPCRHVGSVIIGEDSCGNLFLHAPDGSVSFWDHETDGETVLAQSVEVFCTSLAEPEPVVLNPGQVKKVWIDPNFLAEQKRRGNA
jgi:hypothetical protein